MRLYTAYSQANPLLAATAILICLGAAWTGCVLLGGSRTAGPHLFYIPIALAAVRFSWPTTAATSLGAGLLAGPLLPADVSSGTAQTPSGWLLRLAIFAAVGIFIALLVASPEHAVRSRLKDAVVSARLLRALGRGDIHVFYQPIYHLTDGVRLIGFEALVRWRQPAGRYTAPDSFIPTAERTGAITRLDEYVLNQAVADACAWAATARPVSISVNLSAATLAQPSIVPTIKALLDETGLPPQLFQAEVTESALIHDLPTAVRQVEALRGLGVKVAIDDFGSGQASLNYLQHLPVDVVKLDRSMITAATLDNRSRHLLEGVIRMCDLLELQVIAEGVEFKDQLSLLREVGVPMAQGFLLGQPAPAEDIPTLLSSPRPR
jgi:EAL domain-containing protein (putative c-di-GMP-specific phosphodiesterase class I)